MRRRQSYPVLQRKEFVDARFEALRQKLLLSGHRITPQRLCVLHALTNSTTHPSAEEIYNQVHKTCPTTSLATIYKTLQTLKDMGEVIELEFSDGSNRYDGMRAQTHPHVVCTQCNKITDIDLTGLDDINQLAGDQSGYQIDHRRIEFYGLCGDCQEH